MNCEHERIEQMYGIYFCAVFGEETHTALGVQKGDYWVRGQKKKKKKTSADKLYNAMSRYNFPDHITQEAANFYVSVKPFDGQILRGTAYDSFYHAFSKSKGTVDKDLVTRTLGLKKN